MAPKSRMIMLPVDRTPRVFELAQLEDSTYPVSSQRDCPCCGQQLRAIVTWTVIEPYQDVHCILAVCLPCMKAYFYHVIEGKAMPLQWLADEPIEVTNK